MEFKSEVKDLTHKTFDSYRKCICTGNPNILFFLHYVFYAMCHHLIAELNRRRKLYD